MPRTNSSWTRRSHSPTCGMPGRTASMYGALALWRSIKLVVSDLASMQWILGSVPPGRGISAEGLCDPGTTELIHRTSGTAAICDTLFW